MSSKKPKPQAKPDPATIASSPGEQARKTAELRLRKRGGFASRFRNIAPVGGENQSIG